MQFLKPSRDTLIEDSTKWARTYQAIPRRELIMNVGCGYRPKIKIWWRWLRHYFGMLWLFCGQNPKCLVSQITKTLHLLTVASEGFKGYSSLKAAEQGSKETWKDDLRVERSFLRGGGSRKCWKHDFCSRAWQKGKQSTMRGFGELNLLIDPLDSLVSVAKSSKYQDG